MVDVWKELGKAIGAIFKPIFEIPRKLWETLGDAANDLAKGVMEGAEDLGDAVTPIITPAVARIMDEATESLMPGSPPKEIKEASEKLTEALMKAIEENVPEKGESPPSLETLLVSVAAVVGTFMGVFTAADIAGMALDLPMPAKQIGFRATAMDLINSLQMPATIGPTLQAPVWSGIIAPLRLRMNQRYPYMVLPDTMLPYLRAKDILTDEEYEENMSFYALDKTWSAHALENVWRYPSFSELRSMVHRTDMTWEDARTALEKSLIAKEYVEKYKELVPEIPGMGDLITMMVREVITPEKFGETAALMGYSKEWAQAYFDNHWILLPLGEVRHARHRGLIDDGELDKFLVLHDYKPEPREGIKTSDRDLAAKLVWDRPGRIDARWMYRWGEIDVTELRDLLVEGGLDPNYADAVARATAKNQYLSDINRLIGNIKADYARGYIMEPDLRSDLAALGIRSELVEYHVADALADRARSIRDEQLRTLRSQYARGAITMDEILAKVEELMPDEEARTAWVEALPTAKQTMIVEETYGTEVGRLVTNAKYDYVRGYTTKEDMVKRLTLLDLPAEVIEYHVMDAEEDRTRSYNDKQLAVIEEAYVDDLIAWEDVETMAMEILVDEEGRRIWLDGVWLNKHKAVRV